MVKDSKNTEFNILEAARKVFQRKGMIGARMQEIADEAGINKALLHYYYRSKQFLFEAVFKQAFNLMAPKLSEIINADIDLEKKIRNFSSHYISFVLKHPYLPNFIIQELNSNPQFIKELIDGKNFPDITGFKKQVEEMIVAGKIRAINPNQLFINIMSLNVFPFIGAPLLKGFTKMDNETYQKLLEERKKTVADFIINAIKIEK